MHENFSLYGRSPAEARNTKERSGQIRCGQTQAGIYRPIQLPLTVMTVPCTWSDAADARKTAEPAKSDGLPQRPAGMRSRMDGRARSPHACSRRKLSSGLRHVCGPRYQRRKHQCARIDAGRELRGHGNGQTLTGFQRRCESPCPPSTSLVQRWWMRDRLRDRRPSGCPFQRSAEKGRCCRAALYGISGL